MFHNSERRPAIGRYMAPRGTAMMTALMSGWLACGQTQNAPTSAPTAEPGEDSALERPFDVLRNLRLTGDLLGARRWLEERGIALGLSFTTIYQHNAHGGVQTRHGHRVSASYDLELTLDCAALKLWDGGTLYMLTEGEWDEGISNAGYVGDLFGVNGDVFGAVEMQVAELWYEHALLNNRLRIRLGKLDLTNDFDTNAYANDETAQFLNSALLIAPNIPFPDRGHGIQFVATPTEWLYFGAGLVDAEAAARTPGFRTAYHGADNTFSIYEFGLTPAFETGWGVLPGRYAAGLWYDPQPKEQFFNDLGGRLRTAPLRRDDVGFYVNCDQAVWCENPGRPGDEQGLGLFCRYAYAHADVNAIEHFWSVGGQYQGLLPARDDDVLACGVAQGVLSQNLRLTGAEPHRETALELYYRCQVFPWLAITPDLQWILRPGGEGGRDAFVAGVRLQVAF